MKSLADFSFQADTNGYTIFYKGAPIGGASVKLPRARPLHWKHARANVAQFTLDAQREIQALVNERGQARFVEVIRTIDTR